MRRCGGCLQVSNGSDPVNAMLPRPADNTYLGHKAALVIAWLLLFMKAGISLGTIFNGHTAASSADGIPLDTYGPSGAATVLSLVALVGLYNLAVCIVGLTVLVRYRSLVPALFALFLFQDMGRRLVLMALPIERIGAPAGFGINLGILGLAVVGLGLSLWESPTAGAGPSLRSG